ncbi:MAG: CbiX/SirB N-terminal domain-containing protein [Gemmataceae bacterium]|nr:CbiX/SirB N-terminal domain-containing protein [Gemmataceae bacterium]
MKTALLLIAHGSREPQANEDVRWVADRLRAEFELVETAYLELAEPDILTAARSCVARGATRIVLTPYFLSAGVHVLRDLQECRRRLEAELAPATCLLAEPLGRHELLAELVAIRVRACLSQSPDSDASNDSA